ncbi:MAG: T9SS type A sorting domain-containing protein [Bacteroidota bacterium]
MRKHIRFYLLSGFIVFSTSLIAQISGEEKIPLTSNPKLREVIQATTAVKSPFGKRTMGKTSESDRFPFIDRFVGMAGLLSDSLWALKNVTLLNRIAVFNARNAAGTVYNGGSGVYGETDVLLSKNIDIRASNGQLFIAFAYQTGATWEAGDSLTLEIITSSGTYQSIWKSPDNIIPKVDVRIPIDFATYQNPNFSFRFKAYSSSGPSDTETFLLHNVVLADKLELPFYDNFTIGVTDTLFPVKQYWQQAQTGINRDLGLPGTKVVVFDKFNTDSTAYANNGFADTLHSQPVDVTKFASTDSVYLRFMYKSMPAADNTDSLVLEFLNNTGDWIRVLQAGTIVSTSFRTFVYQINLGRYRHANFQFRLINKCNYSVNDTLQFIATGFNISSKLAIPFIEDFSTSSLFPATRLWKDKQVYINNDFAIGQPSVNVATFDGLDFRGNPYGSGNGYNDTLTSQAINLSGLVRTDSVYLSFYIEPQGLGDKPNDTDSLILEFRSDRLNSSAWQTVWNGSAKIYPVDTFTQISIFVDSAYLHDDFQFRFKNIGSKTGNIDNWHLDYIRLDRGRRPDEFYFDFALTNNPPSLLRNYSSMTRKQFSANPVAHTNSVQDINLRNNNTGPNPLNFARAVFEPSGARIDSFANSLGNVAGASTAKALVNSVVSLNTVVVADSLVFRSKYYVNSNNTIDNISANDTLSVNTIFSNYFAYDDGTAEVGYGVKNKAGAVAIGYSLDVPDTLFGMSMFFNQSSIDVSNQKFTLVVWSNIGTNGNGTGEAPLKKVLQTRPTYTNTRNGFYYLQFDQPLALPAGTFYIGWEQSEIFNLNMGMDENYVRNGSRINPNAYFKIDEVGIWERTALSGALMIRPIMGKWLNPPVGLAHELVAEKLNVSLYPNPATSQVTIKLPNKEQPYVELMDLTGKVIVAETISQNELHLPALSEGMYLVKVTQPSTGQTAIEKLLIIY